MSILTAVSDCVKTGSWPSRVAQFPWPTTKIGFCRLAGRTLLIPLFGHTLGHCGVVVQQEDRWLLHVGDAYYLRAELTDENHPASALAAQRADSDQLRRSSLNELRRLFNDHGGEIQMTGYHDITEIPEFTSGNF